MKLAYQIPYVIHEYGATNEAEYFAVLTETLIEKPIELKQENAELFNLLDLTFGTSWVGLFEKVITQYRTGQQKQKSR